MATRITQQDVRRINELYLDCGTYAGVARTMGISAATVKKYIIPGFKRVEIKKATIDLPPIDEIIKPLDFGEWLKLTKEEEIEIKSFKENEVLV